METKKYWQAVDRDGERKTFLDNKPELLCGGIYSDDDEWIERFLFDVPLKTLQIAEITVCENGTWSYEIEREEGYYMANKKPDFGRGIVQYKGGKWFDIDGAPLVISLKPYTISSHRIPDECII